MTREDSQYFFTFVINIHENNPCCNLTRFPGLAEYIQRDFVEEIAVQSLDLREVEDLVMDTRFSRSFWVAPYRITCCIICCPIISSSQTRCRLTPTQAVFIIKIHSTTGLIRLALNPINPPWITWFTRYQQSLEKLSIKDTQRLHDHSITDSYDYIEKYDERKLVAIMEDTG